MGFETVRTPMGMLERVPVSAALREVLRSDESWWAERGTAISDSVDRAGTPWLQMFDRFGERVDRVVLPPDYETMLRRGYKSGVVWRMFEEKSLGSSGALIYHNAFHDPGVCCPYAVSLATAIAAWKYGSAEVQVRFLAPLLAKDGSNWQGATWMTEIKGGSDLGANVETIARGSGDPYLLSGDKYFASNAGAEVAVAAGRLANAPRDVHGLSLFLVPRRRRDGELNYFIRRLKDKIATRSVPTGEVEFRDAEAYLLGTADAGIYRILEVLNISRVANSLVAVALAQRTLAEALEFAQNRVAFGRRILDHPLLKRQFEDALEALGAAFALAWEAVTLLDEVLLEKHPYSERYQLMRLAAHLAKYWTAEFAVQTAKWAMEVHGGLGVLGEFRAERWLREAMILGIWEGTPHRQILDGLEVMEKRHAHKLLFERLRGLAKGKQAEELRDVEASVDRHLALPAEAREASAEPIFKRLAIFAGEVLQAGERPAGS